MSISWNLLQNKASTSESQMDADEKMTQIL